MLSSIVRDDGILCRAYPVRLSAVTVTRDVRGVFCFYRLSAVSRGWPRHSLPDIHRRNGVAAMCGVWLA